MRQLTLPRDKDGSFNFGCPITTLWAANFYKAPLLCVIFNNGGYNALRLSHRMTYGDDCFLKKTDIAMTLDIGSPPDYAKIAEACHAYGQTVEDPAAVETALKSALEQVRGGKTALLDVRIE